MKPSKIVSGLVGLPLITLALPGCGAPHIQFHSSYVYNTAITVSVPQVTNTNPVTAITYANHLYDQVVFQPLIGLNASGQAVPELAKAWQSNRDGSLWHITLNPFAKWWTGRPVTAQNVVWTLNFYQNRSSGFARSGELRNIQQIQANSATTLTIRLRHPDRDFADNVLSTRGGLWILPSFLLDRRPTDQVRNSAYLTQLKDTVGDGPFRPLKESSNSMTWVAYPHYFLGTPRIKYIHWVWTISASERTNGHSPVDIAWTPLPDSRYSRSSSYRTVTDLSPVLWVLSRVQGSPLTLANLSAITIRSKLPGVPSKLPATANPTLGHVLQAQGFRRIHDHWVGGGGSIFSITLAAPENAFAQILARALAQQWNAQGITVQIVPAGMPAEYRLQPTLTRPKFEKLPRRWLGLVRSRQYWYVQTRVADWSPNVWQPFYRMAKWRMRSSKKR